MKMILLKTVTVGLLAISQYSLEAQNPRVSLQFGIVTAPGSSNNNASIQNFVTAMEKIGLGKPLGLIPTDIKSDPSALNWPHILRASEIIFGPTNLLMWDAQSSNATGAFAGESGQRLAWGIDWQDRLNTFLASSLSFKVDSSDGAHTLLYTGNLATNTADNSPLTFSPTLWGEVLDQNGVVTASYHNGETIADHPVNRVIALIREGYYCTSMTNVQLDLNYFRNQMPLTNTITVTSSGGQSATNWVCSRPFLTAHYPDSLGHELVTIEGQRQLNLVYNINQTDMLRSNGFAIWTTVASNVVDGAAYTNALVPNAFFKAVEAGLLPHFAAQTTSDAPKLVIMNGPE